MLSFCLSRRRSVRYAQVAVALVVAAVERLSAQLPRGGPTLVLGDLYREVARSSPRAEAARALARAMDARVSVAKAPPDPQLQLGFMNYSLPSLTPMPT